MTFWAAVERLLLGPLELLIEVIFAIVYHNTGNPGISIIALSIAVNFIALPLYRRADAVQNEERAQSQRMKRGIDHIRATFKGDERFMMLNTYYRQNNYRPYYVLKGILPLMLEIPFFIAAYRFLSDLNLLKGVPFGPISDLSLPDGMLTIAGTTLNLLPVIMTAVNILSGIIYTRGMPLKSKIQLYGMAGLFLILLYRSPSGLVLYWTMNNLFSLIKNLFMKLKNPGKVFCGLVSAAGLAFAVMLLLHPMPETRQQIMRLGIAALLMLSLPLYLLISRNSGLRPGPATKNDRAVFYGCCVFMTLLLGTMIPSAVISASTEEFITISDIQSPLRYVLSSFLISAGTFLVWVNIYYLLAGERAKRAYSFIMLALSGIAVTDYMFFGKNYGNMSSSLQYDVLFTLSWKDYLINLAVLLAVAALLFLIWKKKPGLAKIIATGLCVAVTVTSVADMYKIQNETNALAESIDPDALTEKVTIPLDRKGQNVAIIILDRAVSRFFPYILEERPELKEQFEGFTYYPNTLSYGNCTVVGIPGLHGGYEYIPWETGKQADKTLREKHDEALKVMPYAFLDEGYTVTVTDPAYAGHKITPDLSIFDERPEINKYLLSGRYQEEELAEFLDRDSRPRNFFCYSVMRAAPVLLHYSLYTNGQYNEGASDGEILGAQVRDGLTRGLGLSKPFMKEYSVLTHLPEIMEIRESGNGAFMMLHNETTHDVTYLQTPNYEPSVYVDNTEYEAEHGKRKTADGSVLTLETENQMAHYHINMAAMIQLGKWLDWLRENGLFDNTRIIIVSDHGRDLGLFGMQFGEERSEDAMYYNPLLLVKDFGSEGELTTNETFMTNADVPMIAFKDLREPVNPMTGKLMTDEVKQRAEQRIFYTDTPAPFYHTGSEFTDGVWVESNKDFTDMTGWKVLTK